ncbi:MAG: PBP1A family penicillin-binding protein [Acidobacteria bacterium]|nr:PBP1A family penicillin-binding protein [Acidobacteriota bacterium]
MDIARIKDRLRAGRDRLPEPTERPGPRSGWRRRWVWWLPIATLAAGALGGVGVAAVIRMPRVDSLADVSLGTISRFYNRNGEEFASFARERRVLLVEGKVPPLLRQAILAAEDANFFQHGGIDPQGVLRSVLRNVLEGSRIGGSTLTMQLARKLYLTPEKTWRRKIEEALLTVEIEKHYSKQQILTLYANLMYLGHGNYGMQAAALDFFGKSVEDLGVSEAATLAGILQRPSSYSPHNRPDLVTMRRDYVLRRMYEEDFITESQHETARAEPLQVVPRRGRAPEAPFFAEEIRRDLERRYGSELLLQRGLQVATTLEPSIQRAAERALHHQLVTLDHRLRGWVGAVEQVAEDEIETWTDPSWRGLVVKPNEWVKGLVLAADRRQAEVRIAETVHVLERDGMAWTRRTRPSTVLSRGDLAWFRFLPPEEGDGLGPLQLEQEPLLEGAVVVLESGTGAVRAMIGGWDFGRSQFNRASQARRQTGSAFKPLVYGAALEMGYTAADTLFDAPVVFVGADNTLTYSPRNFYREYHGISTLRQALEKSYNVTAVKLQDLVTAERVIDFAHRCGIRADLRPYASLALGVTEVSPLELAMAYSTIANQGIAFNPYLIESVSDRSGRVLEQHAPQASKAMEPQVAFLLTHILEGVIDRGTGSRANGLDVALAGKTGTTDGFTDAWFAGFTPRYTIVTWVGHDQKKRIGTNMTGAEAALPIWQSIVEAGLEEGWILRGERFDVPPGITFAQIEHTTGLLPGPAAEQVIEEAFLTGTEPAQYYDAKWARVAALPWFQQRAFYLPKDGERMPDDIEDWTLVQEAWENSEREEREAEVTRP